MPTFRHGKGTRVLLDQYDLSAYFKDASSSRIVETGETTGFGSQAKTYIIGLSDATVSLSGMFEATDTVGEKGVDPVLTAALAQDAGDYLTHCPGGFAVGRTAQIGLVKETKYEVSAPVGDIVSISVEFQCDGGLDNGAVLAAATTVSTATVTNGTNVDNTVLTSTGAVANLHVTSNANTAATNIKVQHSVDGTTFVDLVSFTAVSASTKATQQVTVASGTTINRYVRAVATTTATGAVTYTVAFARR